MVEGDSLTVVGLDNSSLRQNFECSSPPQLLKQRPLADSESAV